MNSSTTTCYYCNKNQSDPKYIFKKTIYSKLDTDYGIGLLGIKKTTRYYEREFEISRCAACFDIHQSSNKPVGIVGLITLILSSMITYIFAKRIYIAIIVGIITGITAMVIFISQTYRKKLKELGIKDANEINEYLPIKDLLDNGWQILKP